MAGIQHSKCLDRVFALAQQGYSGPMTAERFLKALLELMKAEGTEQEELMLAQKVLASKNLENQVVHNFVQNHITAHPTAGYMDGLYMQRKMLEAKASAERNGVSVVTVDLLLSMILDNPSQPLRGLIGGDKAPSQPASAPTPTQPSAAQPAGGITDVSGAAPSQQPAQQPSPEASAPAQTPDERKAKLDALVKDIKRIRDEVSLTVKGQDHAIEAFLSGFYQGEVAAMSEDNKKGPRSTFLFAGPPGVGKTMLAEALAKAIGRPFKRFDMSDFSDHESSTKFAGSDSVYKDSKPGVVTSYFQENPESVVLFDEIEKAHLDTIYQFLQLLDAGHLTDAHSRQKVDCRKAVIIMTSNAGKQLYEKEKGDLSLIPRKKILKALTEDISPITGAPFFPAAICSRMATGNVVMFNHMSASILQRISDAVLTVRAKMYEEKFGVAMQVDRNISTALLFSEGSACDARTITARSKALISDEVYELLRLINSDKTKSSVENLKEIRFEVDLSTAAKPIVDVFKRDEKATLLLVAGEADVARYRAALPNMQVLTASSCEEASDLLKKNEVHFALVDIRYGTAPQTTEVLNVEDVMSVGRDILHFLRSNYGALPVYLLEKDFEKIYEEEKHSFLRQGVRGVISVDNLVKAAEEIALEIHQQSCMMRLERENKLITFETAQTVTQDGTVATIRMFDLKMATAVDSEDKATIMSNVSTPNVAWDDVIGAEDAKEELKLFVEYLRDPKKFIGTGMDTPKGVLLYGPPGTGKTMLAKAMATAAGVTFIATAGNKFVKSYIGEGKDMLNETFETARKYAPAILFIDEVDVIARDREKVDNHSGYHGEDVLTAFLAQVDGFAPDPSRPVFVLAATNYDVDPSSKNSLDQAFLRRFDNRVYVDLPNEEERLRFLRLQREKKKALQTVSDDELTSIAKRSVGRSCANLAGVISMAMRMAVRKGVTEVDDALFDLAFEQFVNGEEKKWDADQLERVARHEAGHALVCWLSGEKPSYITIVARGDHGGYMQHASNDGKAIYTKDEMIARVRTSLAGRAAEIVYYGLQSGISTGASGDLQSATNTVYNMLCFYGMDDEFGLAAFGYQKDLPEELRRRINVTLHEEMQTTIALIEQNRAKIDRMVEALLKKNHLTEEEIDRIFSEN